MSQNTGNCGGLYVTVAHTPKVCGGCRRLCLGVGGGVQGRFGVSFLIVRSLCDYTPPLLTPQPSNNPPLVRVYTKAGSTPKGVTQPRLGINCETDRKSSSGEPSLQLIQKEWSPSYCPALRSGIYMRASFSRWL